MRFDRRSFSSRKPSLIKASLSFESAPSAAFSASVRRFTAESRFADAFARSDVTDFSLIETFSFAASKFVIEVSYFFIFPSSALVSGMSGKSPARADSRAVFAAARTVFADVSASRAFFFVSSASTRA